MADDSTVSAPAPRLKRLSASVSLPFMRVSDQVDTMELVSTDDTRLTLPLPLVGLRPAAAGDDSDSVSKLMARLTWPLMTTLGARLTLSPARGGELAPSVALPACPRAPAASVPPVDWCLGLMSTAPVAAGPWCDSRETEPRAALRLRLFRRPRASRFLRVGDSSLPLLPPVSSLREPCLCATGKDSSVCERRMPRRTGLRDLAGRRASAAAPRLPLRTRWRPPLTELPVRVLL